MFLKGQVYSAAAPRFPKGKRGGTPWLSQYAMFCKYFELKRYYELNKDRRRLPKFGRSENAAVPFYFSNYAYIAHKKIKWKVWLEAFIWYIVYGNRMQSYCKLKKDRRLLANSGRFENTAVPFFLSNDAYISNMLVSNLRFGSKLSYGHLVEKILRVKNKTAAESQILAVWKTRRY